MDAVSAFFKQQPEQHLSPGLFVYIHETLILTRAKHLAHPQGLTRSEASLHARMALHEAKLPYTSLWLLTRAKHLTRLQGLARSETSLHEPQAPYSCEAP